MEGTQLVDGSAEGRRIRGLGVAISSTRMAAGRSGRRPSPDTRSRSWNRSRQRARVKRWFHHSGANTLIRTESEGGLRRLVDSRTGRSGQPRAGHDRQPSVRWGSGGSARISCVSRSGSLP